MLTKNL